MHTDFRLPMARTALSAAVLLSIGNVAVAKEDQLRQLDTVQVIATAEEEIKQSLGVSVISANDLEKRPPVNDLSEILRRQPGVNLTGNANSGSRGNRRQIDVRGMGPDNTLVLIDGQPTSSRNASRMGWTGERDTDGDTAWVPPEAIERVEVLRGPAAARYGSGAMGGVINIITKRVPDVLSGSITQFYNFQQDDKEGDSRRTSFNLAGPLSERVGFRMYGGYAKTDPDAMDINPILGTSGERAAGKAGSRNMHINNALTLALSDQQTLAINMGYSRKSDLYSGDTQNLVSSASEGGGAFAPASSLYGKETTIVHRSTFGLSHLGDWDWGKSKVDLTHALTRNSRATEGLFGGPEGSFLSEAGAQGQGTRFTSQLQESRLSGEVNLPGSWLGKRQALTLGAEIQREVLDDPGSTRTLVHPGNGAALDPSALDGRNGETKTAYLSAAIYAENNINVTDKLTLTPTVRLNQHEEFGFNVSPGLSASYALNELWKLKGGVARAYKTPNLYQSNPNYLLFSLGTGCLNTTPCYLQGNKDLNSETSINKEIGIAYDDGENTVSLAYFHNDYSDKIIAGTTTEDTVVYGPANTPADILRWENTPEAVVSGLEGNVLVALTDTLNWNTNATYMIESEDKTYKQPLSVIPEFTVNSSLDWDLTEKLALQSNVTWYGKQQPATFNVRNGQAITNQTPVNDYSIAGVSAAYKLNKNYRFQVGVNNVFDKQLYRLGATYIGREAAIPDGRATAGARTYNEHGRSFFVSVTGSF